MKETSGKRKRILFVAEAVTLAHVARPAALALGLDSTKYEVYFASAPQYIDLFGNPKWIPKEIESISSRQFMAALAAGSPVYDVNTLRSYVKDDARLIDDVKPDLIVGDFRLSLSVSARKSGIPYAAITNAYWSPYSVHRELPLPVLPFTRFLPLAFANVMFSLASPIAFPRHAAPLNTVRLENGLASLGKDLRRVYTDADHVFYSDVPELIPTLDLPLGHTYLGPVIWTPAIPKPDWWERLPNDRPLIYVTLGSSGLAQILPGLLRVLARMPITVLVATAGAKIEDVDASNIFTAAFLSGTEAAARASLVICNGGSPTSQQALSAGVPVLGICANMDQFLNMRAIVDRGAGLLLRADRLNDQKLFASVTSLLSQQTFADKALELSRIFSLYVAPTRFAETVARIVG